MYAARFAKALAAIILANGVLALCVSDDILASDKEEEAKKYAQDLKTTKDPKVKVTALTELAKLARLMRSLGEPALPEVYKCLEDKDPAVRAAAAYCLGECDDVPEKSIPALTKILNNSKEDESVRIAAAKGLGAMGPHAKDAVKDLREVANAADKKSKLGKEAKLAINSINPKTK
jgi:HEAT repeat protein